MLYLEYGNTIKLTRGDTARITASIMNEATEAVYAMGENDTLTLTVKKSTKDTEPLFQKVLVGLNTFHIEPSDTAGLDFGKYKYDVQLTTDDGDVYTVIEPSDFVVMEEVS